jgi:aspartyl-tRNA(Asn)/glutamyl-tRNA(Gln) amidotransferase subunit B
MQEGSLRFDANVSVRPAGQKEFGTRTETKNLNSFSALEKAIEYEAKRQIEALEDGEEIVQETRTWDEAKGVTRSMRSKEEAHDYRYFPEPDLPPIKISPEWLEKVKSNLPELPEQAQKRLAEQYNLPEYDAGLLTLTPDYLQFFDACVSAYKDAKVVSNWIMGEMNRLLKQAGIEINECKIKPADLVELLGLVDNGQISGKMAKTVLKRCLIPDKTAI